MGTLLIALSLVPAVASAQGGKAQKLVKGVITDAKTGKPVDGGRFLVFEGSGAEPSVRSRVNPGTGAYQVVLNSGTNYRFRVFNPRYYSIDIPFTTATTTTYEEIVKNLSLEPIPVGKVLFTGRMFDPGSSKLIDSPALRAVVDAMKKDVGIVVTITVLPDMLASSAKRAVPPKKGKKGAATDATPVSTTSTTPAEQLKKLGEERAAVVKNLLRQQGISTTRLVWDIRPGVELPAAPPRGKFAGYPDNVIIKITALQEPEDDDQ
jgi:hypothetical protein